MRLALFDLDKTLLSGDSDHTWGDFIVEKGLVNAAYYQQKNNDFYAQYQQGDLDIFAYLEFALDFLANNDMTYLQELHQEFMQQKVVPMVLSKAKALVQKHQEQGDICVIITATNDFVTAPIAALFDIEHLLATQAEILDGQYTGKVAGTPCYQHGKVERIEHWIAEQGIDVEHSVFYSDSQTDIPLLEWSDEPIATNPNDLLKQYAEEKGWPILDLH